MRMASETELKHDFWERMEDSPILMVGLTGVPEHSEPLTAQLDKDQVDTLYFFIARDNRLAKGGPAMAQFVSKGHDFFACLRGTARVDNDPAMIDKLWSNQVRSEEHTSELQSLMRISYAVFCLKKKKKHIHKH